LLPFAKSSDFAFFVMLALVLALYRPGWTFAFFVGTLALENINLAPNGLGISLRPYQFFGIITIIALLVQMVSKRLAFPLPKWRWYDLMPILFVIAGFLSSIGSQNAGTSLKQSIIAASFVSLYFLSRVYIQTFEDLKRILPFFMSSGIVVIIYSIWQNIRFLGGNAPFEVMPGRPNGTFTEADWLGIYITFLISVLYAMIYYIYKNNFYNKSAISNFQFPISNQFLNVKIFKQIVIYICILISYIVLILTVSRSAWIGAVVVTVGFLKMILTNGSLRISHWQWREFSLQGVFVTVALSVSLVISLLVPLTNFQIFNRAVSTGGQQKITIACPANADYVIPERISNLDDIKPCRHINLEDIEKERSIGNYVTEVYRNDPTVGIRAEIYKKTIEQIKENPILGIGWGSIGNILGRDENGASLNASNIFLEVWLGNGILGIVSFITLLLYVLVFSIAQYLKDKNSDKAAIVFVLLGWAAIVFPNLFNSGIFLGFVWAYLAVAVGLLSKK